jgi:hypothetical protein
LSNRCTTGKIGSRELKSGRIWHLEGGVCAAEALPLFERMTSRVGISIRRPGRVFHAPEFALVARMDETAGLNLTTHRAAASVWERRGWDGTREQRAVTRLMIGIGGAALAIQGMRQRSVKGSMLAGLGGTLAWWAIAGEGDLSRARVFLSQLAERAGWRREDLVHDASADSFPASDAPAWTATVGTGLSSRRTR